MTRYEYRFERTPTYKAGDKIPNSEMYAVGSDIANGDYDRWLKFYSDLGAEGWEWVSAWNGPPFLFRRQLPDAP